MTISERLDGVRLPLSPPLHHLLLRDLGTRVLNDYVGGCEREAWYRIHNAEETNPRKKTLLRSDAIAKDIKGIITYEMSISGIKVVESPAQAKFQIPGVGTELRIVLDAIVEERDGIVYGVIIQIGGGFAFRNEVFGTKYSAGRPKEQDHIQAEMALVSYPVVLDRIELLYIDRGTMEDKTHVIRRGLINSTDPVIRFLQAAGGTEIPPASYEKDWTNPERVAMLYADKKITKEKYENFKASNVGGDWQCSYCPFRTKCYDDDRTFR